MWHKGIQHGKGRMEFADGTVKEGLFEDNIFKGSIPNRLKLYHKSIGSATNYNSIDKIVNYKSGLLDSQSRQNRKLK